MPLTLPTHPMAVLPLKLWRPHWFDGVALVIGAVAADLAYATDEFGVTIHGHAWHAVLWWALPLTLIGVRVVRWAAPVVAAHLPAAGPLALRDYGVLGVVRHPWLVTVLSALLGAVSHLGWDAVTHSAVDGGRVLFPALLREPVPGLPWWYLIRRGSDLVGFVTGAALVWYLGRGRLLRRWHGAPPAAGTRPVLFWSSIAVVLGAGLSAQLAQPVHLFVDQAIRCAVLAGLALVAGSAAVRVADRAECGSGSAAGRLARRRP